MGKGIGLPVLVLAAVSALAADAPHAAAASSIEAPDGATPPADSAPPSANGGSASSAGTTDAPTPPKSAAPRTAHDVLREAREVLAPIKDKSMRVTMRVGDDTGNTRVKTLRGYEKHEAGDRKVLWTFESPLELQGTGFLAWQNESEADTLWIYFPGQRRVRRVPPSIRRENFQGSMFTYEDLIAVFFLDFDGTHRLDGTQTCGDGDCFVVDSALEGGVFAYDRLRTWIDVESRLPRRVEFFADDLLKVMTVSDVRTIDGIPSIVRVEMTSPNDGFVTRVELDEITYNQGLDDRLFTIEALSRHGK